MGLALATTVTVAGQRPTLKRHPVDLVHLARQTLGNKDLEAEVLRIFQRQSPSQLVRIRKATSVETRFEAAHTLKGSARAVGAWMVADLAEAVELADATNGVALMAAIDDLEGALGSANAFIAALID